MNQTELCKVPKYIQFQYRNEQQMHCTIEISNLVDKVVSYKIKSNHPELYLVKPMEGSIYNNSKVKVVFTRKELSKTDFQKYLKSPNQNQEKFLFEMSCLKKDSIGREEKEMQSIQVVVSFRLVGTQSLRKQPIQQKKEEQFNTLHKQLDEKRTKLNVMEEEEWSLKSEGKELDKRIIEKKDVILLMGIGFLLGFAL